MDEPALTVRDLTKQFATRAEPLLVLRRVNMSLVPGESMAIMGPSGSGKSTLLHILGTLERPSAGQVRIEGIDPFASGDHVLAQFRNRKIGFVFQDHHLLPQCSALENVLIPTLPHGRDTQAAGASEARARELLECVGLGGRLEHRPAELSGGERQRVAIARAFINRPSLVLADEPTGNLDRRTALAVTDLFFELQRGERSTMIAVTHSPELAARFARRATLSDGALVDES